MTPGLIQRIEQLDTKLLSYVNVLKKQALDAAQQAELEISQGNIRSPIHGVPLALKDLFDMKDVPTTNGMTLDPVIPTSNATVVNKLLDAGAIILGKLKLTEAAFFRSTSEYSCSSKPMG